MKKLVKVLLVCLVLFLAGCSVELIPSNPDYYRPHRTFYYHPYSPYFYYAPTYAPIYIPVRPIYINPPRPRRR